MDKATAQLLLSQNKKTYNSIAQNFSQTRNKIWPELDFFIKNYIKDGSSILDVGCGNGRLLGALRADGSPTSTLEAELPFAYTGIDISEKLIDEASKQFSGKENKRGLYHSLVGVPCEGDSDGASSEQFLNFKHSPKFLINDILNFKSENKFDAIFAIAVLNHIPSQKFRKLAVKNIFDLLKPNGRLLMTNWNLWNFSSPKSWWKLKYPALLNGSIFSSHHRENIAEHTPQSPRGDCGGAEEKLDFKDVITYWGQEKLPLYYHAFAKREIKKLLEINGFEVIKNYYSLENQEVSWRKAKNIVTVAQKN
ncbi:MAG: class I SAM-dependent methyltransferase [bacterium]